MLQRNIRFTMQFIAPYSQSKKYTEKVKPSQAADYDEKNWRKRMHVNTKGNVFVPATGLKQAIESAASLSGDKVEGRGNTKWATLIRSGIMVCDDIETDTPATKVEGQTFSCDAKGNRGDYSTTRVDRTFPMLPPGTKATGVVCILNPEVPTEKVIEYLNFAGRCVGVGRFRPSKGGHNGRFKVTDISVEEVTL